AGIIEQERFEQHGALVEHRPPPEARHAVMAAPAHADANRIDAVLERATGVELEVGGRIAERAPALVAVRDRGADEPRIAEQLSRLGYLAGGERRAHRAGTHRPALGLEPRDDVDGKTEPRPLRREKIGRAGAIEPEMKVEADGDAGDRELREQN